MIEPLPGFPDSVVGIAAHGLVTRQDYIDVLVPAVEQVLKRHDKVRVYYQTADDFTGFDAGAMWEDTKLGITHLTSWDRAAVVTDVAWIRHAVEVFRVLMPATVRVFTTAEAAEARAWIAE